MKKHVALTLLAITTLGVLNAHVDLPVQDGRRFVLAQGRLYDVMGWAEDTRTRTWRHCDKVVALPDASEIAQRTLLALRDFSPPDSRSARLRQLHAMDGWLLAEVEFDTLSPALVPLKMEGGIPVVIGEAIWSGSTEPWRAAPLIRRHVRTRAPQMPQALADCMDPKGALFQPR